jgi:hypothetical protein
VKSTGGKTEPATPVLVQAFRTLDDLSASSPPQTHPKNHHLDLLRRDGGRDQITGLYSWDIEAMRTTKPKYIKELSLESVELTGENAVYTEGAHIFPHKLGEYSMADTKVRLQNCVVGHSDRLQAARAKEKRVQEFWQAIFFMFPSIEARIDCNIDRLSNEITMAQPLHLPFGSFDFGLRYMVNTSDYIVSYTADMLILGR